MCIMAAGKWVETEVHVALSLWLWQWNGETNVKQKSYIYEEWNLLSIMLYNMIKVIQYDKG